jgi:hypothetical protein
MSNPIVSTAAAALRAGRFQKKFNKRESKVVESVKAYVDGSAPAAWAAVAGGTFTTVGGDANETISVPGVVATDVVCVSVKAHLGNGPIRAVSKAAAGSGQIDVVLSGDPTADHVLQYVVFRAR